jgi:hypothetical protein
MTTETITAKIQVRRGSLDDLPLLAEGEFGYAVDYRRLFIGNTPVTFIGNGTTTRYTIHDSTVLPGQLAVLVNDVTYVPGVSYTASGTDIVFTTAPVNNARIVVSFNTEIKTLNAEKAFNYERLSLTPATVDTDTGLSFYIGGSTGNNTASIEYSMKNGEGALSVGAMTIITDGTLAIVNDSGSSTRDNGVSFNTRIVNDILYLTYINTGTPANFYYSIKLWNTI